MNITGDATETQIKLSVDFTRKITTYTFYTYSDIISYLGGIKSAITPIFGLMVPLIILSYLFELSSIIQESYTISYRKELEKSIKFINNMQPSGEQQELDDLQNQSVVDAIKYLNLELN